VSSSQPALPKQVSVDFGELNKGGVAAINHRAAQVRAQAEQ